MDRTMLILQIFAQRARTKEAKLQVASYARATPSPVLCYAISGTDLRGMVLPGRGGAAPVHASQVLQSTYA
eukprot:1881913-Rhodomonas_salina.1